ncbi:transglutaminase-like cysteine peptidase [Salinicola avicenniae]|uniref:transglutaminase-like cysteine peptidase n=1 Tax=Salinicola avicenniae TaxID=2916836 RepID=UPI00207309DD|nr:MULTISPECIES: transglutaminase-like cysteine peptidase [unclassified Salinicola]
MNALLRRRRVRPGRWLSSLALAGLLALGGFVASVEALPRLPSRQTVVSLYGDPGWQRIQQWPVLIDRLQGRSVETQLAGVNDFFNQLRFVDDIDVWGIEDYWATPFEFLGVGAGDCEDFAMAKYLTLRELGVPDDQLRLHYVKYVPYDQFHMVVTWAPTPSTPPVVLDNIVKTVEPAASRNDLVPVYSFNGSHLWISKLDGQGREVGESSRLSLWESWQRRLERGALRDPRG